MPTILFINMFTFTLCTGIIALLWIQTRTRYEGLGLFAADLACQALSMMFMLMRGSWPDWVTVIIPNSLIYIGSMLGYFGLLRFTGLRRRQILNGSVFIIFISLLYYCTVAHPEYALYRNILVPAALLVVWYQCFHLLCFRISPAMRRITAGLIFTFAGLSLVNIARILLFFVSTASKQDFFSSGGFYQEIMILYLTLFFMFTYFISLMVNRRLSADIGIQEEKFSKAFRHSPNAIIFSHADTGRIIEVNEGFSEISGYSALEASNSTVMDLSLWKNPADRASLIEGLNEGRRVRNIEIPFTKRNGETGTGLLSADIITIDGIRHILSTLTDISEIKKLEDEVREMSLRDQMTGLYNRRGLFALADHELSLARREKKKLMTVYIDCDRLKQANDNYGHEAGDRLIIATAEVLNRTFRTSDIIARTGGDEFIILCPDASSFSVTMNARLAENISRINLDRPQVIPLSLSWGISVYDPENPCTLTELLAEADRAMYEKKHSSRQDTAQHL
jgi:diguanylate cyclase (GGDEF)-like protein/PAS domain S-box-containing protein